MNLGSNTVLVSGGASGIGLALAVRFLEAGSRVIVCGRRESKLAEVQQRYPAVDVRAVDLSRPEERITLRDWIVAAYPELNVIVNNAGIQRRLSLTDDEPWEATREEIAINLEAPIHMCRLFAAHLLKQPRAAIVNVGSGLAFAPLAAAPIYCATKAALHSFTLSLRHQLRSTPIEVIEIVPPAVNTDLGGPGLHTFGADVNEFADAVIPRIEAGESEVGFGYSEGSRRASREELDAIFARMNMRP
jgi:uncharacterized oxidoreductase